MQNVLASRPDGLGTRLLTILCARFLCERTGRRLSVAWPSLEDPNYQRSANLLKSDQVNEIFSEGRVFSDLNENDVTWGDKASLNGLRVLHISGLLNSAGQLTIEQFQEVASDYDTIFYDIPECILKGFDQDFADSLKKNWLNFNFAEDVHAAAYEILAGTGLVVHIRRGDIINLLTQAPIGKLQSSGITQIFQRFLPLQTASNIIKSKFSEEKSVIVCTENEDVIGRLAEILPDVEVKSTFGYFPTGGNKSALLDLICMSKASALVAPFKSYFSECAKLVGRCSADNYGLDIESLVEELIALIETSSGEDRRSRAAIVYATGYLNLWYQPELPYRHWLLEKANESDEETARALIS